MFLFAFWRVHSAGFVLVLDGVQRDGAVFVAAFFFPVRMCATVRSNAPFAPFSYWFRPGCLLQLLLLFLQAISIQKLFCVGKKNVFAFNKVFLSWSGSSPTCERILMPDVF